MNNFAIVVIILLIFSCANPSNRKNANLENKQKKEIKNDDTLIAPNTASDTSKCEIIGNWLKLDLAQKYIIDSLGIPEQKGPDEYWGALGTYVQKWDYISKGILLEMESDNQGGEKKVLMVTITSPCKLSTSRGVCIGANDLQIREKYGNLIDASNSSNKSIVIGSIYGGTIFYLNNGVVSKIFIGAAAE
jgi:hypothetical protein